MNAETLSTDLGTPSRKQHRGRRAAESLSGCIQAADRNSRDPLHSLRPVRCNDPSHRLEPAGAAVDEIAIDQSPGSDDMQQTVGQRRIGAWRQLEMEIGEPRGRRRPRVGHYEPSSAPLLLVEVLQDRRHRFGEICADQQDRPGACDVFDRKRQPTIDSERPLSCRRARRHAETAIVVDIAGAQRHPREFAEQVSLLVGEPAAAQYSNRVPAVAILRAGEFRRYSIERFLPRRWPQIVRSVISDHRRGETLAVGQQIRRRPAFLAQAAVVGGKLAARHRDRTAHIGQMHPALKRAIWAVRPNRGGRGSIAECVRIEAGAHFPVLFRNHSNQSPPSASPITLADELQMGKRKVDAAVTDTAAWAAPRCQVGLEHGGSAYRKCTC